MDNQITTLENNVNVALTSYTELKAKLEAQIAEELKPAYAAFIDAQKALSAAKKEMKKQKTIEYYKAKLAELQD